MRQSDSYFLILTDADNSVRFIFGSNGSLVKEIIRNPLGATVSDSNPSFYFPLGYLSQFDDPTVGIVMVGDDSRPLDTVIGRFMTTPVAYASSLVDVFNPEFEADPYKLNFIRANVPRKIPNSGFSYILKFLFF